MAFIEKNFADLSTKERSKLVVGSVIPRPIAWVTSLNPDGSTNLAPFSYFQVLNSYSLMLSFRRDKERIKDTAINLIREREAVIHIADASLIHELDLSSKPIPFGESEVELTGLETLLDDAAGVKESQWRTPAIAQAKIRLHVELMQHQELPNYEGDGIESDLVILRVLRVYLDESVYDAEKNYIDHEALAAIARLGGPYFANYQEIEGYSRSF